MIHFILTCSKYNNSTSSFKNNVHYSDILLKTDWQNIREHKSQNHHLAFTFHDSENILQKYYESDKGFCFIFGDIYTLPGIKADNPNKLSSENLAQYFFENHIGMTDRFIQNVNGAYVIIIYDKNNNNIRVINDKFGLRPSYVADYKEDIIISTLPSFISKATSISTELDKKGLAQLLTTKYTFGERTLRKEIRSILPGSIVEYSDSNLKSSQYFKYSQIINSGIVDIDWESKLTNAMLTVGKEISESTHKVALPLSGGKDTRALAIMLSEYQLDDLISYTWGNINEAEVKTAIKIAEIMHLKHQIDDYDPKNYTDDFEKAVKLTDGLFVSNWIFRNYLLENIRDETPIILDGMSVWGSCFRAGQTSQSSNQIEDVRKLSGQNPLDKVLNIIIDKELRELVIDVQNDIYSQWNSYKGEKILANFNNSENPGIHFRGLGIKHYFSSTRSPLMDYRVADIYLQSASQDQKYGSILTKSLKKINSQLAKLPHPRTKIPLSSPAWLNKFSANELVPKWFYRINKLSKKIINRNLLNVGIPPSSSPTIALRHPEMEKFLTGLLSEYEKNGSGLLDGNSIKLLFADHISGKENNSPLLSTIITYLIWEKQNS